MEGKDESDRSGGGETEAGADLHKQEAMPIAWDQWLKHHPKVAEGVEGRGVTLKQGPVAVSLRVRPPDQQHQHHL